MITEPRPHLVVRKCDHLGVRMAFDARWLAHEGFRGSMPVRCVFSGNVSRSQLIARPLVFIDRCKARKASIDQLTALHEHRVLGELSPRELMKTMGRLEAMPHPFHFSMPYYVSNRYAHMYLYCETHDRGEEGITCEVLIPDAVTGLEWLNRVNGVCGPEYTLLEYDTSLLHGPLWRKLTDECRHRISVWCKLQPREVVRLYLSDADFGRHDKGLAGIVITDRRIVFCKYHHRGQVTLDTEQASILARCHDPFVDLVLATGTERTKMIKLHRDDLDELKATLDQVGNIRVVMGV